MMVVETIPRDEPEDENENENIMWLLYNVSPQSAEPLIYATNIQDYSLARANVSLQHWNQQYEVQSAVLVLDFVPYSSKKITLGAELPWKEWMRNTIVQHLTLFGPKVESPPTGIKWQAGKDPKAITIAPMLLYIMKHQTPACSIIPLPNDRSYKRGEFVSVQGPEIISQSGSKVTSKIGYIIGSEVDVFTVLTKSYWKTFYDLLKSNYTFLLVVARFVNDKWECLNLTKYLEPEMQWTKYIGDEEPEKLNVSEAQDPMEIEEDVCLIQSTILLFVCL